MVIVSNEFSLSIACNYGMQGIAGKINVPMHCYIVEKYLQHDLLPCAQGKECKNNMHSSFLAGLRLFYHWLYLFSSFQYFNTVSDNRGYDKSNM